MDALRGRWDLRIRRVVPAQAAWVALATASDGSKVVLKVGIPHFEAEDEISGLRFWDGDPTVRLLAADHEANAMVLERCEPGTPLSLRSDDEQDRVVAELLVRLWRPSAPSDGFRTLSEMLGHWAEEARRGAADWSDPPLVEDGLSLFAELPRSSSTEVLLATDLHAGNVLEATRRPWLVIDPKPFVGDPAYDATQHLLNCRGRLRARPDSTIRPFADRLGVDAGRVKLWLFARAAAAPWSGWDDPEWLGLARQLAP